MIKNKLLFPALGVDILGREVLFSFPIALLIMSVFIGLFFGRMM